MNYIDDEKNEDFINYKINIRSIDPKERTMNVSLTNEHTGKTEQADTELFAALAVAADANGEPLLDETNRVAIEGSYKVPPDVYITTDEDAADAEVNKLAVNDGTYLH